MCGIAGVVSAEPVEASLVERMRDRLAHRGPDHAGLWRSADGRVCLGNRRLAIIDLTPEANQPFVATDGRYVITFNGEIYNYRRVRAELEREGAAFRTFSDTEVILEAFRRAGPDALDRLTGMFAFAIWDNREKTLFCARDRAGEKPFYYAEVGGAFVFGSELKAIVEYPGFARRLDPTAVADFFTLGFVPDPKSIWETARKLPPGNWLEVVLEEKGARVRRGPTPYWDWRLDPDETVSDWRPAILETLERAAAETAVADVPIGTFLSGGVDSSSVVAALSRGGHSVETFTIGFADEGYDERPFAREVAALYKTEHRERVVEAADVGTVREKLLWHYDEPTNDYSYLPTYYVCREARRQVKVALSGDGGDETFGGYRKYQRIALRSSFGWLLKPPVASVARLLGGRLLPVGRNLRRTSFQYTSAPPEMFFDMLNVGLSLKDLKRAARGDLAQALADYSPVEVVRAHLARVPPAKVGLVNAMRYLDLKLTLAGGILVKVDRASMAVSLELRPVYLHRSVLELAARIPPRLLAGRRQAKGVLKDALRAWLPDDILYRRKMGFAMPLKSWILSNRDRGRTAARRKTLLDELLDPKAREEAAREHASGLDRTSVLHAFDFLEGWLEIWAA